MNFDQLSVEELTTVPENKSVHSIKSVEANFNWSDNASANVYFTKRRLSSILNSNVKLTNFAISFLFCCSLKAVNLSGILLNFICVEKINALHKLDKWQHATMFDIENSSAR